MLIKVTNWERKRQTGRREEPADQSLMIAVYHLALAHVHMVIILPWGARRMVLRVKISYWLPIKHLWPAPLVNNTYCYTNDLKWRTDKDRRKRGSIFSTLHWANANKWTPAVGRSWFQFFFFFVTKWKLALTWRKCLFFILLWTWLRICPPEQKNDDKCLFFNHMYQ